VILFVSEQLRDGQIRGLEQHLSKRLKALAQWKETLAKPHSGSRSREAAAQRVDELLSGQFIREVLNIEYHPEPHGADRLEYWIDEEALSRLHTQVFGKRIVVTNRQPFVYTEASQRTRCTSTP